MNVAAAREPAFITAWRTAPPLRFAGFLEGAIVVACLFLFSQALIGPLFSSAAAAEDSSILRLIWLPVYAVTLVVAAARPGATLKTLTGNWLILSLVGLAMLSMVWSIEPGTTMRRSFALIMTTLFGLWLASRWSWRGLILLIATTFGLLAISSTFMALFVPSLGIDHGVHAGAWKGGWFEKNALGAFMAWGAVSGYAALNVDPKRRWIWMALAVLCSALVLLSTSKTALLSLALGTGGVIGIALCRCGFGFATLMFFLALTGGVLGALVLLIAPVEALEALGRDATLTGRTDIWQVLSAAIAERPWTGYGYKAFWVVDEGPVYWVRASTSWPVPTAHNGWLEIALAVGLPGVALMALIYLRTLIRALSRLFSGAETYWVLPFVAMVGLVSISESNLMQQNAMSWVMLVAVSAKLGQRREPDASRSR